MPKILSLFFLFFISAFAAYGQTQQTVASVIHTEYTINSRILGEERHILVHVPLGYAQPDSKFPVVYMLDAHPPQNAMMVGILEQQACSKEMPEVILVGIQNTNRTRDLTPTDDRTGGIRGNGEKFMQFIEQEVIPLIDKDFRTQPYRIFAGHSFGGLMVAYSFATRPDLFNGYIAASPTLDYDSNYVIKRAEEVFRQPKDWKKTMFIGLGNEGDLIKGFNSFRDLLKKANPKGFDYEFRQFSEENHQSAVLQEYYWGLRKIFANWTPDRISTLTDLDDFYKKLSVRFGYRINPPEEMMNQIGYQLLKTDRAEEAIAAFKKNVENYPNSPNVYDSLGDALDKNGQPKSARDNYEKAYKLAEAQGNALLAKASKAKFEKLSKAL